jgi:hypothetical protein
VLFEAGHPRAATSRARAGLLVAAAAATPFAAGALLYEPTSADVGGPTLLCPFRAATGLPCPLCGSTRAIVLAAHGDTGFVDYNAIAVLVLVAAIVLGLAAALAPRGGRWARDALARFGAAPGRALLVLALVAWAWTLTHRTTITS